jgi:hypothetical protein
MTVVAVRRRPSSSAVVRSLLFRRRNSGAGTGTPATGEAPTTPLFVVRWHPNPKQAKTINERLSASAFHVGRRFGVGRLAIAMNSNRPGLLEIQGKKGVLNPRKEKAWKYQSGSSGVEAEPASCRRVGETLQVPPLLPCQPISYLRSACPASEEVGKRAIAGLAGYLDGTELKSGIARAPTGWGEIPVIGARMQDCQGGSALTNDSGMEG